MSGNQPPTPSTDKAIESREESARNLIKNSGAFIAGDAVGKLLSFLFSVYVIRQLGSSQYGLYTTALAYAGLFSIMADLGMTQFATREIARGRKTADGLFWNLIVIRFILSTFAIIIITASAAYLANYNKTMVMGIFIACMGFYFHALYGPISIILRANERIEYLSLLTTIGRVFTLGLGTYILLNNHSFYILIVSSYIWIPITFFLGFYFIRKLDLATFKPNLSPQTWYSLLKHSLPFAMITFTLLAARDLDTILLSLWKTEEEVGLYKAAYNLIFKLMFIRSAIIVSLTPQMSRHYGVSKERVTSTFNFFFKFLWTFSVPIAIGGMLLAEPIIDLLYTDEYAKSAIAFAILIWSVPLLNLSSLCGAVTTATDKEKEAVRVYGAAALLNLITNLMTIPYWGYIGAAVSTIFTEFVTLFFFYSILHKDFPLRNLNNLIFKPLLASILMGIVVFFLQNWFLIGTVIVGMVVYVVALLLFKPFSPNELKIINSLLVEPIRRKLGLGKVS